MQIENHANLLKSIFKIKDSTMFYIDKTKNSKTTNVATMRFFNLKTEATNLDKYIDLIDAKLFAIEKAIEFCVEKAYSMKIVSNV